MAKEYLMVDGKLVLADGDLVQVPDAENLNDLADENGALATQSNMLSEDIENLIVNGVIDGAPRGVYDNLSALQTAYPNGASGVYLTKDDGHWYYYNNGWQDGGVYQATEIADGSITPIKTSFMQKALNVFNQNWEYVSGYIDPSNGSIVENSGYISFTNNYCEVEGGEAYRFDIYNANYKHIINDVLFVAYYDNDFNYIGGTAETFNGVIIPTNCKYMKISFPLSFISSGNKAMLYKSTTIKQFEYYKDYSLKYDNSQSVNNHIITVGNSSCMFTNLREAIESITDASKYNNYTIYIQEGTYNIEYTEEEQNNTSYFGVFIPDYVTLEGIGSKKATIITTTLSNNNNRISLFNVQNVCALKNLTLQATKTRYIIHDDWGSSPDYITGGNRIISNCIFKSEDLTFGCMYGCGLASGSKLKFENCQFISVNNLTGLSIHNNVGWLKPSDVTIINCKFTDGNISFRTLNSYNNQWGGYCYLHLYGNYTGTLILSEEGASIYGAGIRWFVDGYNNKINSLLYQNTDGLDYSDQVTLLNNVQ